MESAPGPVLHFHGYILSGDPFTHRAHLCGVLHSFMSRIEKTQSWKTQEVMECLPEHTSSEWGNAHRHQNITQGPAEHRATGWDWSRNLSFPAGTRMAFVVTIFILLSSSSQCPCEDLGQSQIPEDFPGTEATIWVCPAHISFPLSHERFGIYFALPWLEQALSFLSLLQIKGPLLPSAPFKLRCFNFKWKFPLSQTVQNYHGKDFTLFDHTISDLIILIRLHREPDIYFKEHYQRTSLNSNKGEVGTFLGKKRAYFNILISLCITNGSGSLALAKQRNELVTNKICLLPEGHEFHVWQHT